VDVHTKRRLRTRVQSCHALSLHVWVPTVPKELESYLCKHVCTYIYTHVCVWHKSDYSHHMRHCRRQHMLLFRLLRWQLQRRQPTLPKRPRALLQEETPRLCSTAPNCSDPKSRGTHMHSACARLSFYFVVRKGMRV
jgi:hypothetical protein